jgi:RNA polymerase sigma-70 factor (ECF subfamily)
MTEGMADNSYDQVTPGAACHRQEQGWRQLLQQIVQQDQEALGAFYDATSPLVYGLALRILRDVLVAEEVTIDVYTSVWRQAASYDPQRWQPSAWLFMLTRSRALDYLRTRRQGQKLLHTPAETGASSAALPPEDLPVLAELRHLVQDALAKLIPEQRRIIELAYFSGWSQSEIAASLGLPLGTVKTHLRLGVQKLHELVYPLVEEL